MEGKAWPHTRDHRERKYHTDNWIWSAGLVRVERKLYNPKTLYSGPVRYARVASRNATLRRRGLATCNKAISSNMLHLLSFHLFVAFPSFDTWVFSSASGILVLVPSEYHQSNLPSHQLGKAMTTINSSTARDLKIAIVGAGPAGTTLARLLQLKGFTNGGLFSLMQPCAQRLTLTFHSSSLWARAKSARAPARWYIGSPPWVWIGSHESMWSNERVWEGELLPDKYEVLLR